MRSDAEIRDDVIGELRWDPQIPEPDAIGVAVTDGAVTGVTNAITINPPASPASVRAAIEDALRRAAKSAAAAAPGVASVENHLVVTP